ncbi:hypothetical protein Btru_047694 [Bulinus truncatus]|nr:hypothetical protein Btru_047694 [Bulinus truncatus]
MAVNTTKYISNLAKQSAEERKASAKKDEGSIVIRSKSIDAEAVEVQVSRPEHELTVQPKKMRKLSGSSERQRTGSVTAQLDSETKTARRKSSKKEDKVYKHSLGKGHDKRASRPVVSQKATVDEVERQTDAQGVPSRDDLQKEPSEDDLLEVLGWKDLQRVASRKELQRVSSRKDVHRVSSRKDMQRVSSRKELKIASSEKDLKREPSPMEIKPKEEIHKVTGRVKSKTSASDFVSGPKKERRSTSYDLERASPEHGVSPRLPDDQQGAKKPKDREMDRIVLSLQSKAASDTVLHRSSSGIELVRSKSDSKVSFEEGAEAKWRLDEKRLRFRGHRNPFTIHWTESATDLTDFIGPASFLKEIQTMKGADQTARKKILPSIGAQDKERDLDIDTHVQKDTDVGLSEVRDGSTTRGGKETIPHKHAADSSKKQPAKKISREKALATDVPSSERVHAKSSEEVELSKKKSLSKRVHSSPSSKAALDDRDLLAELAEEKIQLRKKFAKKMRDKSEWEQSLMHAELMKKIAEVTELSKKRARELGKVRRSESMLSLHEDKKATLLREDLLGPLGALPAEEDETADEEEDSTTASPLSSSEQVADSEGSAPPPPKHQKHMAAIKKHAGHGSETRLAEAKKADRTSATKVKGLSPVTMSDTNIMKRAKSPETLPVRSHKSLMALGVSRDKITPQFEQVQRKSPSDLEDWLQRHFSDRTPEELSHEVQWARAVQTLWVTNLVRLAMRRGLLGPYFRGLAYEDPSKLMMWQSEFMDAQSTGSEPPIDALGTPDIRPVET